MYRNNVDLFMSAVIDCSSPVNMTHAAVVFNGNIFEDTANYTCEVGLRFSIGTHLVVTSCNDTGNWTMPTENCQGWQRFVHLNFAVFIRYQRYVKSFDIIYI